MKRIAALVLILCMIFTFAACGPTDEKKDEGKDADISASTDATGQKIETVQGDTGNPEAQEDNRSYTASWLSSFAFAGNDAVIDDAFEDVTPMYNLPDGHEFKIKVNLKDGFFLHSVNECFGIFTDRECTNEVDLEMEYDDSTGYVMIAPSLTNTTVNSYPREGIETGYLESGEFYLDTRTWGGLKTYYLVIKIDANAETLKFLNKPMRMMFTIAADVDSPTVKAKTNNEGDVTLYWDQVKGTEYYKVYMGSRFRLRELGRTDKTEFVLDDGEEFSMNSLLDGANDYAVVAVKGEKESRLSNIIKGEDYAKTAPLWISELEADDFSADDVTIMDLPRDIDVVMADRSTVRAYPVIWDFKNPEKTYYGGYVFYGKVPGTTLTVTYRCLEDQLPTEEEIEALNKEAQPPASVAEDNIDKINIPNSPSIEDVPEETAEEIVIEMDEEPGQENELSLAQTIALGMLNHETTIDLSAYPEAGDPEYLCDVIQMVLSQSVLIMDEEEIGFDFENQYLIVKYGLTAQEGFDKQQKVLEKAKEVINTIIADGMSVEEKERVIHGWIVENGRYHDEVLQAYYDGVDLNEIAEQYTDSFNVYGILVDGLGVCQSYAETFKLMCDLSEVPAVVTRGLLGSVPHAWNKVMIGEQWYNVDVTNNDDNVLPYPVYNSSDRMLMKYYSEDPSYVLDSEFLAYSSYDDSQDYYYKAGLLSRNAEELKKLIADQLSTTDLFFIKTDPDLTEEAIMESVVQAVEESELQEGEIKLIYHMNILGVKNG